MADWPNITDSQCDPDAPVTSELVYGLRDGPIAIAEGAVGAPRIQYAAIAAPSAGNAVVVTSMPNFSVTAGSTVARLRFSSLISGVARINVTSIGATGAGNNVTLVRVRNGNRTDLNSFTSTGSFDFQVLYGDSFIVEQRANTDTVSAAFNISHNGNSPSIIVTSA